jgi:hypothetical protein
LTTTALWGVIWFEDIYTRFEGISRGMLQPGCEKPNMIKFIVILFIACALGLIVSALWYPVTGAFAMIGTFWFLYRL